MALTALNSDCSHVAVSPDDGGEGGGGEAGGEVGAAATVTVTVLLTLPAELVAVRVKVLVLDRVAVALPDEGTSPPPGDSVTVLAPEVLHVRSDVPAPLRLAGLAENELMTGGVVAVGAAPAETFTVTDLVTLPLVLAAVNVYVVVTAGVAITLPVEGT
jgi:hypothetical protein